MTIQTSEEAVRRALATETNVPGMCQQVVRGYFDAPSAGDADGDGDSDAADGYFKEPPSARNAGDRNPPAGKPLYFSKAGGKGNGHRALSLEDGLVRSTDFDTNTKKYKAGVVGTGTLKQVEAAMGVTYVGWTKTIDGYPIPPSPVAPAKKSRGKSVDHALKDLNVALKHKTGHDKKLVNDAKKLLLDVSFE